MSIAFKKITTLLLVAGVLSFCIEAIGQGKSQEKKNDKIFRTALLHILKIVLPLQPQLRKTP